jgi:hypothetical protein
MTNALHPLDWDRNAAASTKWRQVPGRQVL